MACWTRPTTAIRAPPALYRSPVTLQPWLTTITLKYLRIGRAGQCLWKYHVVCVCVYYVCVSAGIQIQEFSTLYACMFSSCKGCCPWNRKLSTMGESGGASALYGKRTVCADSNSTVGWWGTPASCTPIPACFPFSRPGDFSPAGVEVYAGETGFSLILWGRGVLNSLTFIFPNDVSVRSESFLKRIRSMFREYIVVLREGLRWSEIKLIL